MSAATSRRTGQAGSTGTPGDGRTPLRPAKQRTGSGAVPVLGVLLALCVLALAAVLVRDGLVLLGAFGGTPWTDTAVGAVSGTAPATWLAPAGVAVALLGLYLVVASLGRRTRKEVRLRRAPAVTITPRDVARLASAVARDVDGVATARSTASRRAVDVTLSTTGEPTVGDAVKDAVTRRLSVLDPSPRVRVRVLGGDR